MFYTCQGGRILTIVIILTVNITTLTNVFTALTNIYMLLNVLAITGKVFKQ